MPLGTTGQLPRANDPLVGRRGENETATSYDYVVVGSGPGKKPWRSFGALVLVEEVKCHLAAC